MYEALPVISGHLRLQSGLGAKEYEYTWLGISHAQPAGVIQTIQSACFTVTDHHVLTVSIFIPAPSEFRILLINLECCCQRRLQIT